MKRYQADRAVRKRGEDLLARYPFAEQLADAFVGWREDESLVVALTGSWGSGKTSIKNFVIDALQPQDRPARADVLEFTPWELSGSGNIEEHFFSRIGKFLGRKDAAKQDREIAEKWAKWTAALRIPQAMIDPLTKYLSGAAIALGIAFMGISAATINKVPWIIGAAIVEILGYLLAASTTISERVTEFFAARGKAAASAAILKEELAELLKKRERPLVLIVDDVDRLTSGEIRLIFRLIKANADLPRLLYFILFERDAVTHALEREGFDSGEKYLEKMIQAAFTVPAVQSAMMTDVIISRLNEVLRPLPDFHPGDQQRWTDLFFQRLHGYFTNLRDVYRFLAAFEFHAGVFHQHGSYEVNVIDLFVLEVLRMFEFAVYERLLSNKRLLVHRPGYSLHSNNDPSKKSLQDILVPARNAEAVRAALSDLFPLAAWAWGGHHYGDGFDEKWAAAKRVATEIHFDKYFHLAVPKGEIAQYELDQIVHESGNRDAVRQYLQRYKVGERIERFLIRLDYEKERLPIEHIVPFVTALFDEGDDLPRPAAMFVMEPDVHLFRIVYWCLRRFKTIAEREVALEQAIVATEALYGPAHTVHFEEPRDDRRPDIEPIISPPNYPHFQQLCVEKIERAAADDRLLGHPHFLRLLYFWLEWTDGNAVREWASKTIEQPLTVATFLRGFIQIVKSQGIGSVVTHQRPKFELASLEKFVALDAVEQAVKNTHPRDDAQEEAIKIFQRALDRRKKGLPDQDKLRPDDDE